jgi:hypothetical protein
MFQNVIFCCVIFDMKHKKGQTKPRGIGFSRLERCCGLEGFQTNIHPERYMATLS